MLIHLEYILSQGVTNINDGYLFQHHPLSRSDLADLIGVPGYDEDAIREVLDIGNGTSWFSEDVELTKENEERKYHTFNKPTTTYDALEFWGKVSGKMLREWGLTEEEIPDEAKEYDANVWAVGNYIIKAVLNYDPLEKNHMLKHRLLNAPVRFGVKVYQKLLKICKTFVTRLQGLWSTIWGYLPARKSKSISKESRPTKISRSSTRGKSGKSRTTR